MHIRRYGRFIGNKSSLQTDWLTTTLKILGRCQIKNSTNQFSIDITHAMLKVVDRNKFY